MQALKLAWLGTRTGHFTATVESFRNVLGLELVHSEAGFAVLDLPGVRIDQPPALPGD